MPCFIRSRWYLAIIVFCLYPTFLYAQKTNFGINLSSGKEPVEIKADSMEMQDREGLAIFTGNVSVIQGHRNVRAEKMFVYYKKARDKPTETAEQVQKKESLGKGLGNSAVDKIEALGKVYIQVGKQVATGDKGVFDGKSNMVTLSGSQVVLTDGKNTATGCRLTAHMDDGKALLQSCASKKTKNRVSVIVNQ